MIGRTPVLLLALCALTAAAMVACGSTAAPSVGSSGTVPASGAPAASTASVDLTLSGFVSGHVTSGEPRCILNSGGRTWDVATDFGASSSLGRGVEFGLLKYEGPKTYSDAASEPDAKYYDPAGHESAHNVNGGQGPLSLSISDGGLTLSVDAVIAEYADTGKSTDQPTGRTLHVVGTIHCANFAENK